MSSFSNWLNRTINSFPLLAACLKKLTQAASLYFCVVKIAITTSAICRIFSARRQFATLVESTSGVSSRMSCGGTWAPTRQYKTSCSFSISGATLSFHGSTTKPSNSFWSFCSSAHDSGTRQTGYFVPDAWDVIPEALSRAKWLKTVDLPTFVPPAIATIKGVSPLDCTRSFDMSESRHGMPTDESAWTSWAHSSSWGTRLQRVSIFSCKLFNAFIIDLLFRFLINTLYAFNIVLYGW